NEAVSNAHRHAQRPDGSGRIRVIVQVEGNTIVIMVSDDGPGFAYSPRMSQLPDPFASKGRGFFLMNELMDAVNVDSGHNGTNVSLTWSLDSADILAIQ
ncbi:MAG: ATP-binding protein, partial [Actinomycetota bacterium]